MASFAQLELNSDSEGDEDFVPGKYGTPDSQLPL